MTENCGVARHAAGPAAPGTVGFPYDGVESRIDPRPARSRCAGRCDAGLLQGARALTRQTFTDDGWLIRPATRALTTPRALEDHRPREGPVQDQQGKYVAPAPIEDRLVIHVAVEACVVTGANLGQPLASDAQRPTPQSARATAARTQGRSRASLEKHLKEGQRQQLDPHEQLDCLVASRPVDRRERLRHADDEGQAQPHRGGLRRQLRALGEPAQARDLVRGLTGERGPGTRQHLPELPALDRAGVRVLPQRVWGDFAGGIHRFADIPARARAAAAARTPTATRDARRACDPRRPRADGDRRARVDGLQVTLGNNVFINPSPTRAGNGSVVRRARRRRQQIGMPPGHVLGAHFGSLTDRFGVQWMLNRAARVMRRFAGAGPTCACKEDDDDREEHGLFWFDGTAEEAARFMRRPSPTAGWSPPTARPATIRRESKATY